MSPLITVMRMEKCPKETYADVGGLESQINEIKVTRLHFSNERVTKLFEPSRSLLNCRLHGLNFMKKLASDRPKV